MKKYRAKKYAFLLAAATVMIGLAVLLFLFFSTIFSTIKEEQTPMATPAAMVEPVEKQPQEVKLSILCVGDVMTHMPVVTAQYDAQKKKYDFSKTFQYAKPYIKEADLSICNLETTFAGKPYTGYPTFSAPDSLAKDLKDTGFDVAMTANNHMVDKGLPGIKRTLKVLKQNELIGVGSVTNPDKPNYQIAEVKGVKIGLVAYTFETGNGNGTSINGNMIPKETARHINSFHFNNLDKDAAKIKKDVDAAKAAGAQVLIVYYHWGEEFQRKANSHQEKLAQKTADMGVDIIFASHPHVLQKATYLTQKETGKKVPIFYSMGNFLSNQRAEYMNDRYTEHGLLAKVDLTYLEGEGVTEIFMDPIPTWVDRYYAGGKVVYRIIPLDNNLKQNKALATSGHLSVAKQALEDANGVLGLNKSKN